MARTHQLEFEYVVGGLAHVLRHGLDVVGTPPIGSLFSTVDCNNKGAGTTALDQWVDDIISVMVVIYDDIEAEFIQATLWEYTEGGNERQYISSHAIGEAGTNNGSVHEAGQIVYSFKTTNGGNAYWHMLESNVTGNLQSSLGALPSTAQENIRDTLLGTTSPVVGEDGGFLAVGRRYSPGENEVTYRRRFRP